MWQSLENILIIISTVIFSIINSVSISHCWVSWYFSIYYVSCLHTVPSTILIVSFSSVEFYVIFPYIMSAASLQYPLLFWLCHSYQWSNFKIFLVYCHSRFQIFSSDSQSSFKIFWSDSHMMHQSVSSKYFQVTPRVRSKYFQVTPTWEQQ